MSVSVARQSSSSSSIRSFSSSRSISSGMSAGGLIATRAPSVYGGAGGYGTRISQSSLSFSGGMSFGEGSVVGDEKMTMQNLNDRLASYLQKVRSLEAANSKLELQIREFYEKRAPSASSDYSAYFATISNLRAQILSRFTENQKIVLLIDNARLAADDFKVKGETELGLHCMVDADIARLRGVRDDMTLSITDLEGQLEGLKEELVYMKANHQEEMNQMRIQCSGNVNVEVDSAESVNLQAVLSEVREQYEALMTKNKNELERWFQTQVSSLQTEITTRTTEVKTSSNELTELKRMYQSLEISSQGAHAEIQMLQQNLEEVKSRYSLQLSQLQMTITTLESELQQLKASMEQLKADYSLLLDIKMRLELEIAEYRRLLEGEYQEKKTVVVVSKVEKVQEKVEEVKPHIEKRVRTIVEEIVDGRVVSSSVDTQVESIQ